MGRNRGNAGTAALAIAFTGVVSVSSLHCGDEVTEANIGPKLAAALCDARNDCCASQGFPLSEQNRLICEGTAQASLYQPGGYVFNQDIAVLCLRAAQAYECRDVSSIDAICRRVYTDPAVPMTRTIYGPEGAACGGTVGTCAFYDGLTCIIDDPVAQTGICQKLSMTGGVCGDDWDCVVGDYCDSTKTCRESLPAGAPCTRTSECKSANCMNSVCILQGACALT
jgi:hypothetical protein